MTIPLFSFLILFKHTAAIGYQSVGDSAPVRSMGCTSSAHQEQCEPFHRPTLLAGKVQVEAAKGPECDSDSEDLVVWTNHMINHMVPRSHLKGPGGSLNPLSYCICSGVLTLGQWFTCGWTPEAQTHH